MFKTRIKLRILQVVGFIFLIAPLVFVFIKNRNIYFKGSGGLDVSIGCIIALVISIIVILGHTKVLKGIILYALIFILSYLFRPIVNDIVLLSGMALLGKTIHKFCFEYPINRLKSIVEKEESALINAKIGSANYDKVVDAIKGISGRI